MKKIISIVLVLAVICGIGWFVLLRPEAVSQETLENDFASHQQAYEDIAYYLTEKNIATEICDIPIAGERYEGVTFENTDAYAAFMDAIMKIMEQDHDKIVSDGRNVEFIYHSTGGMLNARNGSVIYTVEDSPARTDIQPLNKDGWFLWLPET